MVKKIRKLKKKPVRVDQRVSRHLPEEREKERERARACVCEREATCHNPLAPPNFFPSACSLVFPGKASAGRQTYERRRGIAEMYAPPLTELDSKLVAKHDVRLLNAPLMHALK